MILLIGIIASFAVKAQNSDFFNYQAVVRDANGNAKANTNFSIYIEILQGSLNGNVVFSETQTKTSNSTGVITLQVGSSNSAGFSSIDWSNAPFFIRISVDGIVMGTNQLLSVPYALYSRKAESYNESDPIFLAHPSKNISNANIANWDAAYSWGDHALAGYLKSFIETDPIFSVHPSSGISATDISNWSLAYTWGNHAAAGYLTSFTETDPVFSTSAANGISSANISNWNAAFSWGNHQGLYKSASYLPDWSEITNKPFNILSPANNQLLKFSSTSNSWENWTPNFLTSEAQTLSLNANQLTISGQIGNSVTFTNWDTNKTDDVTSASPSNGDMLYYNGTNWVSIPKGTTGQVLTMGSAGAPEWQNAIKIPPALTLPATFNVSTNPVTVTFNGKVNPNNLPTTVTFEYGTTTSYGSSKVADQSPITGYSDVNVSCDLTNLVAGTLYHFRVKTVNALGTSYGDDMSFTLLGIGLAWEGGIIFYLDSSGQHGLVAATADQTNASWGCLSTAINGADGTAVGTGNQNTVDITNGCLTAGIAAKICLDLDFGGYTDWYLPSKDELGLMYSKLHLAGKGGFNSVNYWSSSEATNDNAFKQNFSTGSAGTNTKDILYFVRAARSF